MSNESILKPMSVARNEFINDLTDLINNCMLPPFIIEDVLKDIYSKVSTISAKQLEADMKKYQEALEANAQKNISV